MNRSLSPIPNLACATFQVEGARDVPSPSRYPSPFKGEVGRGWGAHRAQQKYNLAPHLVCFPPHPHPGPPLEGEGRSCAP